jgi:hypothetical protein
MRQGLEQQEKMCKFQKHLQHLVSTTNEITKILLLSYGMVFSISIYLASNLDVHIQLQFHVKGYTQSPGAR